MTDIPNQQNEDIFAVNELTLGNEWSYLKALVAHYPGVLKFETGAGHIFPDLINRLPSCPGYDEQKKELCNHISEIVYPLAASLSAQAVSITLTVSGKPLAPPSPIMALATYAAFDEKTGILHYCFISPRHKSPDIAKATIAAGLTVYCEPLNYHYHQLTDDRGIWPRHASSNLPNRYWPNRNMDSLFDEGGHFATGEQIDPSDKVRNLSLKPRRPAESNLSFQPWFQTAAAAETINRHIIVQPVAASHGAVHRGANYYHAPHGPHLPDYEP